MEVSKSVWDKLSAIDVNKNTKKVGRYTYLSWSWAWATLMSNYPESTYKFEPPVFFADQSCEVWVSVSVEGITHSMWLPVMDNRNNPILKPHSRQISDTRMRCLTKCLAMFGLGHYIYAGDSYPTLPAEEAPLPPFTEDAFNSQLDDMTGAIAMSYKTADQIIKDLEEVYTVGDGAKAAIRGIK